MDFRLALGPQPIALVPEAPHYTGAQPSGAAGPLVRGIHRDALEREAVDATLAVVARDLLHAAVDHDCDTRHGERGFGDVGGDYDAASRTRRKGRVLCGGIE